MMVALFSAQSSLNSGYTTLVAMGSHGGGYADVELKKAIQSGLVRMLKCPDFVIALLEDAVAIGGSLFVVSRF